MFEKITTILDATAKSKGYFDKNDLLRDYGFIPTVLTPKHKRIEFAILLIKNVLFKSVKK